jgi:hypothetical protein
MNVLIDGIKWGIGHLSEKKKFSGGHLSENYFSFT